MNTQPTGPTIVRDGAILRFEGALVRGAVAMLWARAPDALDTIQCIDLTRVERIDSAGLALVSLLASHCDSGLVIDGAPEGFPELRAAYRLGHDLSFARD